MKSSRLMVRVTPDQLSLFKLAAEAEGLSLSSWIVVVALKAAKAALRSK